MEVFADGFEVGEVYGVGGEEVFDCGGAGGEGGFEGVEGEVWGRGRRGREAGGGGGIGLDAHCEGVAVLWGEERWKAAWVESLRSERQMLMGDDG